MSNEQKVKQYENFLRDTLQILFERATERPNQTDVENKPEDSFASAKRLAYYETLSIIQHQAESFEIGLDDIYKFDLDELLRV